MTVSRSFLTPRILLVPALILAAILSGCAQDSDTGITRVAELPRVSSSAGTDSGTSNTPAGNTADGEGSGRPQMRLDDSPERRDQLIGAWNACLIAHGATADNGRNAPGAAGQSGTKADTYPRAADPVPDTAKAACTNLLPLMPKELEAATNPKFRDQSVAWISCLRDHGIFMHLLNAQNLDANYDDSMTSIPDNAGDIDQKCTLQAFGSGK
ncbi:hypothetical protein [Mycetocola sp. JXN-3]|uniref:hypothetical protein n=1 Tax=Mycetocola sp. JXN-3 TaxID=2116510 RepID=UPI00165CF1F5|nr:hypothetical protein [Mycetocola sp. JXN-3]